MKLGRVTPILRSFDEAKGREFYVDFLGFKVDWEHRFEPVYGPIEKARD
jgi:hypothetical protein